MIREDRGEIEWREFWKIRVEKIEIRIIVLNIV